MDPAQPMTTHGHAEVCACAVGQGGILIVGPAKAVSARIQVRGPDKQDGRTVALTVLIGIIEGAKKNIAPINMVLTILRSCISPPLRP